MERKVSTLSGFIAASRAATLEWGHNRSTIQPWFRGQSSSSWPLVPGLYRSGSVAMYEREVLREFKLRAPMHMVREPANDLEWLFVMQHHGAPTRLLDWSENHLAALFFAVGDSKSRVDGAVWALDPWSLNEIALGQTTVPVAQDPRLTEWLADANPELVERKVSASLPVAVRPPLATARITAQRGTFTLHGSSRTPLNRVEAVRVTKITIDRHAKPQILKELWFSGVTYGSLFPDLDGLSQELAYRFGRRYDRVKGDRSSSRVQSGDACSPPLRRRS